MPLALYQSAFRLKSRVMYALCWVFTLFILVMLALVTVYLVSAGWRALHWSFFSQDFIAEKRPGFPGGMRHGVAGTGIMIALATIIGIPIGMLCGIYLSEYAANSRLASHVRFVCDVLAGVPSIVVGILGYQLLVVPMGHESGWAGALALAFIMVPIVARTTEEMLRLVPGSYREASIALGATKARTILRVVVPSATGSLVTGVMLALARVAGETAPLLFTAGTSIYFTVNPNQQFPSLTALIYDAAKSPSVEQKDLARAGILVLISLIFVLNLVIRYFARPRHGQTAD